MSKTVVIHQPDFIPYPGFFHRFLHADLYLVLDHVKFVHKRGGRSWTHRDMVKSPAGARWLTLHVKKPPHDDTPIHDVELAPGDWRSEHLNLIREYYRPTPFFDEIYPGLEALYARADARLMDCTMASIELLSGWLDTPIPMVRSSTLAPVGRKTDLLVDLLRKVGATCYLSGVGARAFIDEEVFRAAGVALRWQEYTPQVYPQPYGAFVPNLSSIDVLFNCGIDGSRALLRRADAPASPTQDSV